MRVTVLWMVAVLVGWVAYGGQVAREYGLGRGENGQIGAFTVEELGAVIEGAGHFWEDWWEVRGRFGREHLEEWPDWEVWDARPAHIRNHLLLLPSSGFERLEQMRDYLLQYYTAAWVEGVFARGFYFFVEYEGALYMDIGRYSSILVDWNTATHRLVGQFGRYAVVESTMMYYGTEEQAYFEGTRRFWFVDGRISRTSICPWVR